MTSSAPLHSVLKMKHEYHVRTWRYWEPPVMKRIQVTCLSVLGVLDVDYKKIQMNPFFCLHSLRSNHLLSHRTRPVFSNLEVRLMLKCQIQIAKHFDLSYNLIFNFFEIGIHSLDTYKHYYIVMLLEFKEIYAVSEGDQSSI